MEYLECDPDEVIIASSTSGVFMINPQNGTIIKAYKNVNIASKCLAMVAEEYLIGASMNVPDIKCWPVREEKCNNLISSPCGVVNALAVTSCGSYCVAALKQEIRVWSIHCGEMLAAFSPHFQDVSCLKFTSDDSMFLSGGKDGNVFVWPLSKVTSVNSDCERVKPLYSWNNHTHEVTDIFVGSMSVYSRVATTSLDMTCKVYEIDTGLLLSTVCMDVPLTSVAMDPLEYYLILGTQKGTIYKINLYEAQSSELHSDTMEKEDVVAYTHAVTSLSMSIVGDKFLSASMDKIIKIWAIASLTCLSSVSLNDGCLITNAFFTLHPTLPLIKQEPQFLVRQLERKFISPGEKCQEPTSKAVKLRKCSLSIPQASKIDDCYHIDLLNGKCHIEKSESSVAETMAENIFQEAFKGETLSEVREINAQMYTYMIEQAFKSMEPAPYKAET